jgi:hypothetical protein
MTNSSPAVAPGSVSGTFLNLFTTFPSTESEVCPFLTSSNPSIAFLRFFWSWLDVYVTSKVKSPMTYPVHTWWHKEKKKKEKSKQ